MSDLRALACVALLALGGAGCGAARDPARGPRLTAQVARALDARLQDRAGAPGLGGASAAVVFPDGRVWSGAVGAAVLDPELPMTPRMSLPFDSVTKVATAALALRIAERGRLALDAPIRRWYRGWHGDPRATVRDLLGHTAGMRDPPLAFFARLIRHPRRPVGPRRFLAASPAPGRRTRVAHYSNSAFVLAGLVLERAAREPLAAAMRRELFGHAGGAGLALQPLVRSHPPRVHNYWYQGGLNPPEDASDGGPILPFRAIAGAVGAAGALAGDVPSLARWAHELLGGRILAPGSLREMTRFHPSYGLGLARRSITGRDAWGHSGAGFGSHTELWHLPHEHLTVAVAWNRDAIAADATVVPALLGAALG